MNVFFDTMADYDADAELMDLANQLLAQLKMKNLTLATAESATGGFISHLLTNIDGSSKAFIGGVIAYSAHLKNFTLKVDYDLINDYGTISPEVTEALLDGLKQIMLSDIGIAITGVAGSYILEGKPRGLMYIGIGTHACNKVKEFRFHGTRMEIKRQCAKATFEFLLAELENM
ncbi:Putative competence-damage inducible protein [Candidatus Lokiarchaeum ossiferum]|uniref:Competence-damage inducible protein n=1 Tax=Candidatus Lokiarchaeum ossiferum TaxID=2951803 RepID=A0ABY6HQ57_9ARCH|nr:Putative competence-damage inducible protein [Candidatus Lokiarchaeum sp. B-35]